MIEANIFNRVNALLQEHKRNLPSPFVIYASLLEEVGELAQALKVERGIVNHKILDESAKSEAVDVYICAAMMYFEMGGAVVEKDQLNEQPVFLSAPDDPFAILATIGNFTGALVYSRNIGHTLRIADLTIELFALLGGKNMEEFKEIATKKLDKWQKNQTARRYREPSTEKLDALKNNFDAKSWDETADGDKNLVRK